MLAQIVALVSCEQLKLAAFIDLKSLAQESRQNWSKYGSQN